MASPPRGVSETPASAPPVSKPSPPPPPPSSPPPSCVSVSATPPFAPSNVLFAKYSVSGVGAPPASSGARGVPSVGSRGASSTASAGPSGPHSYSAVRFPPSPYSSGWPYAGPPGPTFPAASHPAFSALSAGGGVYGGGWGASSFGIPPPPGHFNTALARPGVTGHFGRGAASAHPPLTGLSGRGGFPAAGLTASGVSVSPSTSASESSAPAEMETVLGGSGRVPPSQSL